MGLSDIQYAEKLSEIEDYLVRDQFQPSLRNISNCKTNMSIFTHLVLVCGGLHTAILKGDGGIIMFGDNQHAQCSLAEVSRDHVVQVACG